MLLRVVSSKRPLEVDLSVIEDLAAGDKAARAELIATFIRHTNNGIGQVRKAIGEDDFARAAQAAHTCVGFTASLGISVLVPILRELERALRARDGARAIRRITQWEHGFAQVRRKLLK